MEKKFERKILTSGHRLKGFELIVPLFLVCVCFFGFETVYGHGIGSETFPPVDLNGNLVTLEVSSSQSDPEASDDQQISISLIDFDSNITLRDVTFLVKSERGEQFLFEQEFRADNGFIVFNFVSDDTNSISVEEDDGGNLLGSLLGFESRMVHVKGPNLSDGGLYKLDVTVLTAGDYSQKLEFPPTFNAGISIAQKSVHNFVDPNFGKQNIHVVTYYDEISKFQYDPISKEIKFSMPFDWNKSNINQTSVVHEEIIIPKTFGDLLVSGFSVEINGIQLSEDVVTIDDFFSDERVVHFIIYQRELMNVFENGSNHNGMNFVIKPDLDYVRLSSVTENGQFKILTWWEPENLKSNANARIFFDVYDVFLKNRLVSTNYEFTITQNDRLIFEEKGVSKNSENDPNVVEFVIPDDVSGIIHLNFGNLDNNNLAKTSFPIVIDRIIGQNDTFSIPEWVRNNAEWWSQDQIDDNTFILGVEYLIKNQIIEVSQIPKENLTPEGIPEWVRNNAEWWAAGQIDDKTFVQGLEYLIQKGIIRT